MQPDRRLTAAEWFGALHLLHRVLGVTPCDPAPPAPPPQSWRTCAGCPARPVLTYQREGRRYCPRCWDGPVGPVGPIITTHPSNRRSTT